MLMLQMVSELSSAAAELEREALPALEVLTKRVSARHALCMLHALMTKLRCRLACYSQSQGEWGQGA